MVKTSYSPEDKIVIRNLGGLGHRTTLSIGDKVIPVLAADIRIRPDELVTIDLTVKADEINR